MFIKLADAQKIDPNLAQEDIDSLQQLVHNITLNTFAVKGVHIKIGATFGDDNVTLGMDSEKINSIFRIGDTIGIHGTGYNDGYFDISAIEDSKLSVRMTDAVPRFISTFEADAHVTLVRYPADIRRGVLNMVQWTKTFGSKQGIKSESVSRLTVTYADSNATEMQGGYPKSLTDFLSSYTRLKFD